MRGNDRQIGLHAVEVIGIYNASVAGRDCIIFGVKRVVAFQNLTAFESPHLNGAKLAVACVPEVGTRFIVCPYARGKIGNGILGVLVAVDISYPCCTIALVACPGAHNQFGEA